MGSIPHILQYALSVYFMPNHLYLFLPCCYTTPLPFCLFLVTTSLFSVFVILLFFFLLNSLILLMFFVCDICDMIQYFSFSIWLISLSIMPSKSIHFAANGKISFFLWINSIPWSLCVCVCVCVYTPHLPYLLICWWTLRLLPHLGYCK